MSPPLPCRSESRRSAGPKITVPTIHREHILHQFASVIGRQSAAAGPVKNQWRADLDKPLPSRRAGRPGKTSQQRFGSRCHARHFSRTGPGWQAAEWIKGIRGRASGCRGRAEAVPLPQRAGSQSLGFGSFPLWGSGRIPGNRPPGFFNAEGVGSGRGAICSGTAIDPTRVGVAETERMPNPGCAPKPSRPWARCSNAVGVPGFDILKSRCP